MVYNPAAQKLANYKWVQKNREKHNAYVADFMKGHYEKTKEEKKKKSLANYYVKKEFTKFLNILL